MFVAANPLYHSANATMTGDEALGLAIVLGSSFSIVGVVFCFITFSLFSDVRNLSGMNLVNFLASLFLAQLLFVMGADGVKSAEMCTTLSLGLQFCHLSLFTWMFIMMYEVYRHCKSSVNLTPNTNSDIKADFCRFSLAGWGLPLLLVGLHLTNMAAAGTLSNHPPTLGCWRQQPPVLVLTYTAPVLALALASLGALLRAAIVVRYAVSMQIDSRVKDKMRRKRYLQLLLHGKLLLLFTLVAVLSTISSAVDSQMVRGAYGVLHSLLGLVVTLCLTCNCKVLHLYAKTWRQRRHVITQYGTAGTGGARTTSMEVLVLDTPEVV